MLLEKEGQRRENTVEFYKKHGKKVLEYFTEIGITRLEQLTYDDANRFLIYLRKTAKLSEKTVVARFSAFRQIILVHTGTRTKELKKILEISLKKPVSIHRKPLNEEQQQILIDYIDSIETKSNNHRGLREKLILMICIQSGVRAHELFNILVDQINYDNRSIRLVETKSHKERDIIFDSETEKILKEYIEVFKPNRYLFENENTGERMSDKRIFKLFNRIGHKLGFKVTSHMIRSTQATVMVNNNANDFEIMEAMGHSDIRTTQIYVQNILGKTNRTQREYNILAVNRRKNSNENWMEAEKLTKNDLLDSIFKNMSLNEPIA